MTHGPHPTKQDFDANEFNAYNFLRPIATLYSEECESVLKRLNSFCSEFEKSTNIVELSDEYFKAKEMCVNLRVRIREMGKVSHFNISFVTMNF